MDATTLNSLIAGGAAIGAGISVKVYDTFFNKPGKKDATPAELRAELRSDIASLKSEVLALKEERDETEREMLQWREKYWELVQEHSQIQRQMLDYLSELHRLKGIKEEK